MISGANDVIITGWNDQKMLTLESLDISLSIYAPKIWRELKHYLGVTKKSGYARNSSEGAISDSCETCAHSYVLEAQNTIYLWQGHHHFVLIPPPGNRERPLPLSRVSGTNMVPPLSLSWVPAHSTEIGGPLLPTRIFLFRSRVCLFRISHRISWWWLWSCSLDVLDDIAV